ncbi:MAG: flavin reductase family protein [Bacteroidetes bacterium]|nr:flavin reductase family protein [Bacteroidota bacterium]
MSFRTLIPEEVAPAERHQMLLSAVAPRPVCFASTVDAHGRPNLAPFSFFNIFSSNPPVAVFSPARSGRDGTLKDTLLNIREVPEVVINIVSYAMVQQMSLASTAYPRGINEFEKAGFTALPSDTIKPFRVAESPAQFECTVREVVELGSKGGAGNLIIADIQRMHFAEHIFGADGRIDPHKIDLIARMGYDFYCRASGTAVFEVEKPIARLGMGVDALPERIRLSAVLSGNHLGMLGNTETLPSEEEANSVADELRVAALLREPASEARTASLHRFAAAELDAGNVWFAFKVLMLDR